MRDGYRIPAAAAENDFKNKTVRGDEEQIAYPLGELLERVKMLREAGAKADDGGVKARDALSKRWRANYDYVLARLEEESAYVMEYQSMLGALRKELPAYDVKLHTFWKLASIPDPHGDGEGKKLAKSARARLDKLAKDNPGTPWEVLAKGERLTALGLEWQPVKQMTGN
jgi:hypothetical protein